MANERYKLAVAGKKGEAKLHEVTLPSGFVWKLKEPPVQQFITAGKLPGSLVEKMVQINATYQGQDAATISAAVARVAEPSEVVAMMTFARDLLMHCAVDPRIVIDGTGEDEIDPAEIDPEDFQFLMTWVWGGGKSGEVLTNFRQER